MADKLCLLVGDVHGYASVDLYGLYPMALHDASSDMISFASDMIILFYLPLAFIKDWFYRKIRGCSPKSSKNAESVEESTGLLSSPAKHNVLEVELGTNLTRKDSGIDFSTEPQCVEYAEVHHPKKQERDPTAGEIMNMAGVIMTTLGKTWASDESQLTASR
ncbi:hypothetical protein AKJ16_DCAP04889 [Drosera capensis]